QAQQRVEAYNFDIRKRVVEYDDVMNTQRNVIYAEREKVLNGDSLRDTILDLVEAEVDALAQQHLTEDPDPEAFRIAIDTIVPEMGDDDLPVESIVRADAAADAALDLIEQRYEALEAEVGEDTQRIVERLVLLRTIDSLWVEHLTAVDEMRQGIGLRAYAQQDPLVAYKREAHDMWEQFRERIRTLVTRQILRARVAPQVAQAAIAQERAPVRVQTSGPVEGESAVGGGEAAARPVATVQRTVAKVGRNAPCPCGSGKKYKHCHGAPGAAAL
ncbi:MAG: SEC-C metal-binding domain-containing protein, partial [Dehalococcoidia bacterium]|nr:SEC-C metal-binding domain-containing protein [Dehalococcoidia bacterium]